MCHIQAECQTTALVFVMKGPSLPMRQICVCYWNGLKVYSTVENKTLDGNR